MFKLIIGLGNPGPSYYYQRHNIGFRVLDVLAERHGARWQSKKTMELAELQLDSHCVMLVKPQTYMNSSGHIIPFFIKQGIKPEEIVVVHDELELPFGKIALKHGGSAKGHNGLKSIIAVLGSNQFYRLRCGIGRPEYKEQVPDYVLSPFSEPTQAVHEMIEAAVGCIESQ